MSARLLPLLLALAAAEPLKQIYTTISGKVNGVELRRGPSFYLRDTQCLGYIPPSYLCGSWQSLGVEVLMTDGVAFPMVEVDASLRNVSVARRPNAFGVCRDVAYVDTRVRCRGYRFSHLHSKRARPLPDPAKIVIRGFKNKLH